MACRERWSSLLYVGGAVSDERSEESYNARSGVLWRGIPMRQWSGVKHFDIQIGQSGRVVAAAVRCAEDGNTASCGGRWWLWRGALRGAVSLALPSLAIREVGVGPFVMFDGFV
jgi:hypothetical protein